MEFTRHLRVREYSILNCGISGVLDNVHKWIAVAVIAAYEPLSVGVGLSAPESLPFQR
jgi:hypothetical protein